MSEPDIRRYKDLVVNPIIINIRNMHIDKVIIRIVANKKHTPSNKNPLIKDMDENKLDEEKDDKDKEFQPFIIDNRSNNRSDREELDEAMDIEELIKETIDEIDIDQYLDSMDDE